MELIWKFPPIDCKLPKPKNDTSEYKEREEAIVIDEEDEIIWKFPPIDCKLSKPKKETKEYKE